MTSHAPGDHGTTGESSRFVEPMARVIPAAERFGHRQQVHLTWLGRTSTTRPFPWQ